MTVTRAQNVVFWCARVHLGTTRAQLGHIRAHLGTIGHTLVGPVDTTPEIGAGSYKMKNINVN